MSIEHTEGLVLKTYDYSETSKIAAVFTKGFGKIKVIAKGARSKNSRTSAIIEPGTFAKIIFYLKGESGLFTLSEASIIDQFAGIRTDIVKFAQFMYILELIDALFEHEEGAGGFFGAVIAHVKQIEKSDKPELLVRALEIKILSVLGHMPQLKKCVGCGKPVPSELLAADRLSHGGSDKKYNLSISQGGILCKACSVKEKGCLKCSASFLRIFFFLAVSAPGQIDMVEPVSQQLQELKIILRNSIDFLTGKRLKSLDFLEKVSIR